MYATLLAMLSEIELPGSGGDGDSSEDGGEEGFTMDSGNEFTLDSGLLEMGGGLAVADADMGPDHFHKYGNFRWIEFESKEEMFEYVRDTDNYGWNAPDEALCFGFQVHENEEKNKYELELFFRDQWPGFQTGIVSPWAEAAPLSPDAALLGYIKHTMNGFL